MGQRERESWERLSGEGNYLKRLIRAQHRVEKKRGALRINLIKFVKAREHNEPVCLEVNEFHWFAPTT